MAEPKYYSVVTDAGAAKIAKAVHDGKKINIIHMAAGDGRGEYYQPKTSQTMLLNEVWRGRICDYRISKESENLLIVSSIIEADAGGFTVRELGIFDDEGTMIAVCNTPATGKVRISDGVVHELHLSMEIILVNDNVLELVIDPTVFTATKEDIRLLRQELHIQKYQSMITNTYNGLWYQIGMDEKGVFITESEDNPDTVLMQRTKTLEESDTVTVTLNNNTYGVENADVNKAEAAMKNGDILFELVD